MIIWVLAILLQSTPMPVYGFLEQFDSLEACQKKAKIIEVSEESKEALGCMAILKPGVKEI